MCVLLPRTPPGRIFFITMRAFEKMKVNRFFLDSYFFMWFSRIMYGVLLNSTVLLAYLKKWKVDVKVSVFRNPINSTSKVFFKLIQKQRCFQSQCFNPILSIRKRGFLVTVITFEKWKLNSFFSADVCH